MTGRTSEELLKRIEALAEQMYAEIRAMRQLTPPGVEPPGWVMCDDYDSSAARPCPKVETTSGGRKIRYDADGVPRMTGTTS